MPNDEELRYTNEDTLNGHPILARATLRSYLAAQKASVAGATVVIGPMRWVQVLYEPLSKRKPPPAPVGPYPPAAPAKPPVMMTNESQMEPPRHPPVTRTSRLFVEKTVGINVELGQWHLNAHELNQGFVSQGYSTTGQSHTMCGLEFFFGRGRWRGTFGGFALNSKNVKLRSDHDVEAAIFGGGVQVSAAYSLLKFGRFSAMPELGFTGLFANIHYSKHAPPLALGGDYQIFSRAMIETAGLLLHTGLRLEVRAIELHAGYDDYTYLTLGNYLGWEQQFATQRWNIYDGDDWRGSFSSPKLSHTGPVGLIYVGVLNSN